MIQARMMLQTGKLTDTSNSALALAAGGADTGELEDTVAYFAEGGEE
jgi:hypothetical protein